MSCQQLAFEGGQCLVEIQSKPGASEPQFTAFMSIVELEADGAIVRPMVSEDGHRVRIHAPSEALALDSALTYLESRFGAARHRDDAPAAALGTATVGWPFVVKG